MRHLLIFAALLALLAVVYYVVHGGTTSIEGRIALRDLHDQDVPGAGARVVLYRAEVIEQQLRSWLEDYDKFRRENGLTIRAARNEWNQKVALRDEAARILRVAERANSADLEICRARHREAAADAEDALRRVESLGSAADRTTHPALFLASLPPPSVEYSADAGGRFRIDAPQGVRGFVCATLKNNGSKEELVWLREISGLEREEIQLSNANLLTAETLAGMARAQKKPESRGGPPAE